MTWYPGKILKEGLSERSGPVRGQPTWVLEALNAEIGDARLDEEKAGPMYDRIASHLEEAGLSAQAQQVREIAAQERHHLEIVAGLYETVHRKLAERKGWMV